MRAARTRARAAAIAPGYSPKGGIAFPFPATPSGLRGRRGGGTTTAPPRDWPAGRPGYWPGFVRGRHGRPGDGTGRDIGTYRLAPLSLRVARHRSPRVLGRLSKSLVNALFLMVGV